MSKKDDEHQKKLDWIDLELKELKDTVIQTELDRQIDQITGRVIYSASTSPLKN